MAASVAAASAALSGSPGKLHAVGPGDEAARLEEPGGVEGGAAHHQARPEGEPGGEPVGLGFDDAGEPDRRAADPDAVADAKAEARQQLRLGDAAEDIAVGAQQVAKVGIAAADLDRAGQRIGLVDRLQFDQRLAGAVDRPRHGAQRRDFRHGAVAFEEGALFRRRLALDQIEGDVAAEDRPALAGDAVGHAAGDRADAGDGGDAERDAGEEDAEAAQAAAQLADREARRDGEPGARAPGVSQAAAPRHGSPRRRRSIRRHPPRLEPDHAAGAAGERQVVGDEDQRRAALRLRGEQKIGDHRAVGGVEIAGRLVGKQDRRVGASARAMATRCCSPPESCGRIVRQAIAEADGVEVRPRRGRRRRAAPASSSGTATFSSAVMLGMRWKDWKTMPISRPRSRASPSSSRPVRSWPATTTRPALGRSSPAMTISSVDLPLPEGPTRPSEVAGGDRQARFP